MADTDTREQVAAAKGIPAELADRLQGSTREELEADADVLICALIRRAAGLDGPARL